MWHSVTITHDRNLLRMGEQPLAEKFAEALNKLQEEHDAISLVTIVHEDASLIEAVVQTVG
jgi:hypothetical protein